MPNQESAHNNDEVTPEPHCVETLENAIGKLARASIKRLNLTAASERRIARYIPKKAGPTGPALVSNQLKEL
jgi:hypothetical protein